MAFNEVLRSLIERQEISQKQLAQVLNIAPSTLGNYVQGVNQPDFDMLKRIARYFDVSTDYLLEYSPSASLQNEEQQLVAMYHSLSAAERKLLLAQAELLAKYFGGEKK